MLYQRYFLRTNQSHMVHLLVLLCILFTCMAIAVVLSDYETQVQCSLLLLCCILIYLGKFGSTGYAKYVCPPNYVTISTCIMYGLHSVSSHNRHSVTVRVERSIPKFRVLRGAGHFPADRVVFRRADQIPSRHRTHVSVRLHFLQFTAGQVAVCHCGRHCFHVVAVNIHPVYGTRHIETGN